MHIIAATLDKLLTRGFEAFGVYYGTYKAFVTDREDPLHYGRLKLVIPNVTGAQVLNYWAYPCNCYAGKGYGAQVIPQKGDLVWVEFEQGNTRRPLWKFGYFGLDEKPEALKDYDKYWFKTPKGNLIEFDDTKGTISLTSANGVSMGMNEDGSLKMTSANGQEIEMSQDGKIKLGTSEDADLEPAALGAEVQKANDCLFDSQILSLGKALLFSDAQVILTTGTLLPLNAAYVAFSADLTQQISDLIDLKVNCAEVKSDKVKMAKN